MKITSPRTLILVFVLALVAAACGGADESADTASEPATSEAASEMTSEMASEPMASEMTSEMGSEDMASEGAVAAADACTAEEITEVVQSGPEDGTLEGMTDDPVATAATNNPVLTTLETAVVEAGLVDTLNQAEAVTVFAPTDCAFAELDPATLEAALADPSGLLTQVLGFHVVAGEQLAAADLTDGQTLETFGGETLEVSVDGETVTVGGGQAEVIVPDIQTANGTVHLIDAVMLPPSAQ